MRISKKIAAIFLAVVMVVSAIPFTASAVTFSANNNANGRLNVPALNVGDLVRGEYTGIDYDGRTLVLDYSYNDISTKVTLEGDYSIDDGMIKKGDTTYFNGSNFWEVKSIDNGVVTLGNNTVNGATSGMGGFVGQPLSEMIANMGGMLMNGVVAYRQSASGNLYYTSLEDAVADSLEGETIKLVADVHLEGKYDRSEVSYIFYLENRTLDLNGKKITMYNHAVGFSGDNMVIKNGTFECVATSNNPALSYALPIYPEIFERQSTTSGDLNTVADKSTGVVLEDLTLNPGGLNVKGAEVTCKNLEVTGHTYYGVSAEFDSVVTIESGSYTTTTGGAKVILTSDMTDGHPSIVDNTQYIIKGGTFKIGSANAMFNSTTKDHYTVIGGTFQNSSNEKVDVSAYYDTEIFSQNGVGTVIKEKANNGASITVAETISENFYIDEAYYEDVYGDDVYITANYNHNSNASETPDFQTESMELSDLPALNDSTSAYDGAKKLSVFQAPAQSTELITVNVYASQADAEAEVNPVDTITYSVYEYCKAIINDNTGKVNDVKPLAKATLDYAAASQTYFNYNTANMATKDTAGDFYNTDLVNTDLSGVAGFASLPDCVTNATMVVKSDLEINLLANREVVVESASIAAASGTSRFEVATKGQNGDFYVINVKGIEPANMDAVITIETSEGVIQFTANAVMKVFAGNSDANLATLAKAMYLYGKAANVYFA